MRNGRKLAVVGSATVVFASVPGAMADDLNPPPWRGLPDSTFQHWTFGTDSNTAPPDPGYINPNGVPSMSIRRGSFWEPSVAGRDGVWSVVGGGLFFRIPNDDEPNAVAKFIWIQVTWRGQMLPSIFGVSSTAMPFVPIGDPNTVPLADGWFHTTWQFSLKECPAFEDIDIFNPGVTGDPIYFDQVVIDTICVVPSPATGMLALGGLIVLGGRRR